MTVIRTVLIASAALAAAAASGRTAPAPVMVGGDATLDACGTLGEVAGMQRSATLAVRARPDPRAAAIDRLRAGDVMWICEDRGGADRAGGWYGVVYAPAGTPSASERDCGVSRPIRPARRYAGPCKSGWVSAIYVNVVAG